MGGDTPLRPPAFSSTTSNAGMTQAANFPPVAGAAGPGGDRNKQAFMTEGPEDGQKQDIQFLDMPRPRRPKTKPQENYVPQASSASATTTKLLQKRRKDNEWQQLLELKREEFAKRMAECDARQADLKKKCKDLRKRVQTKEQEVQETRSKIDRATKKQEEEKVFQELKNEEIEDKKRTVKQEEKEQKQLEENLERTSMYKQYLDRFCEENEQYADEVDRVLQRYESLAGTKADLENQQRKGGEQIEKKREHVAKESKDATADIVKMNGNMSAMRSDLDGLRSL